MMHFRLTMIGCHKNRKSRVILQLTIASRQRTFHLYINRGPAEAES